MDNKKIEEVARLRAAGKKYKEIADLTGLPVGTVKTMLHRATAKKCEACGKPLDGKKERFCSDACRIAWWNANRGLPERTCPVCGRGFMPKDPRRIYCGPGCYHAARRKPDGEEE